MNYYRTRSKQYLLEKPPEFSPEAKISALRSENEVLKAQLKAKNLIIKTLESRKPNAYLSDLVTKEIDKAVDIFKLNDKLTAELAKIAEINNGEQQFSSFCDFIWKQVKQQQRAIKQLCKIVKDNGEFLVSFAQKTNNETEEKSFIDEAQKAFDYIDEVNESAPTLSPSRSYGAMKQILTLQYDPEERRQRISMLVMNQDIPNDELRAMIMNEVTISSFLAELIQSSKHQQTKLIQQNNKLNQVIEQMHEENEEIKAAFNEQIQENQKQKNATCSIQQENIKAAKESRRIEEENIRLLQENKQLQIEQLKQKEQIADYKRQIKLNKQIIEEKERQQQNMMANNTKKAKINHQIYNEIFRALGIYPQIINEENFLTACHELCEDYNNMKDQINDLNEQVDSLEQLDKRNRSLIKIQSDEISRLSQQ